MAGGAASVPAHGNERDMLPPRENAQGRHHLSHVRCPLAEEDLKPRREKMREWRRQSTWRRTHEDDPAWGSVRPLRNGSIARSPGHAVSVHACSEHGVRTQHPKLLASLGSTLMPQCKLRRAV